MSSNSKMSPSIKEEPKTCYKNEARPPAKGPLLPLLFLLLNDQYRSMGDVDDLIGNTSDKYSSDPACV